MLLLHHQQRLFLGGVDAGDGSGVEGEVVGFNAVAEDDAVGGHLGFDGEGAAAFDHAGGDGDAAGFAEKGFAYDKEQARVIPGHS